MVHKPGSQRFADDLLRELRKRRAGILQRVESNGGRARDNGAEPDWVDAASQTADVEMMSRLGVSDQELLVAVNAAVSRLVGHPETAGVCQSEKCCGNSEIEPERLKCFPETRICSACARAAESGRVPKGQFRSSGFFGGRRRGQ